MGFSPNIISQLLVLAERLYIENKSRAEELRNGQLVLACVISCNTDRPEATNRLNALLSAEELDRAGRFRFVQDQISFLFAHALTRVMLSVLLPRSPREWEFVTDELGRPGLRPGHTRYPVCFSLSHTRGLAACALGVGLEVGIDVETCEAARLLDSHGDWLTKAESAALNGFAPNAKGDAAVQFWTLKEAFAKATGLGLYQRFGDVGFTLDPPRFASIPPACAGHWWLTQMRPTPAHVLAVAVRCARRTPIRIEVEALSAEKLGEPPTF
jgi:4'-phosphopantetheinyl transferase